MTYPSISCIMATRNRPQMAARALAMFALQDYPGKKEMVIVDSGSQPLPEDFHDAKDFGISSSYIRAIPNTPLGMALNIGCDKASGYLLHKWDDDDLYGEGFLSKAYQSLKAGEVVSVAWKRFLVITQDGVTRVSQSGLAGGGSILMVRDAWAAVRWRELRSGVDAALWYDFDEEYGARARVLVDDAPEMYTVVRHGGNMWQSVKLAGGVGPADVSLDEILMALPVWTGGRS